MTYATVAASGRGRLVFFLRISGFPWVLATADLVPAAADTWYWNGASARFLGVKPWLSYSGLVLDENASFVDGTLDVGPLDAEVVDVAGGFTALLGAAQYRVFTRLDTDITAAHSGPGSALSVESVSGFAAQGVVWVDREAIYYDHVDAGANEFHVLTRGYYGTIAAAHQVDTNYLPAVIPIVTDGCTVLGGRRANLYAAEVVGATVTASECVFRGFVAPDCDAGEGVYRLRIDHIASMWSRNIGQRLPRAALRRGYSYTGGPLSTVTVYQVDTTAAASSLEAVATITGAYYSGGDDGFFGVCRLALAEAQWNTVPAFERPFYLRQVVDHERICLVSETHADYETSLTVRAGDYLWALGFDPGEYKREANTGEAIFEAQHDPRLYVGEIGTSTSTADLTCEISGIAGVEIGEWAVLGQNPALLVAGWTPVGAHVDGDLVVTFEVGCDPVHQDTTYISIDSEDDLLFRQVIFASDAGETISSAAQKFLGLSGLPTAWAIEGLEADDFDFAELTTALVGTPTQLQGYYECIDEPATVGALICDRLGVAGILPRITDDGSIGFAAARTPHAVIADTVEVDSAMWSIVSAAKVRTVIEGVPRITQVKVESDYDYRSRSWGPPVSILVDGINNLGKTISKDYRCRGLRVGTALGAGVTYGDFAALVAGLTNKLIGCHFGLLGRGGPIVSIGCTWTSRQLMIGDIVKITHPGIHDVAAGTVGVTDRLGIVVGRTLQLTDQGEDVLRVLIPAEQNAGPISPCARATAWDPGTLTLTVPITNYYAQTGENDLTWFAATQELRFTEYDVPFPSEWGPTTVASVGANSIVLDADPFGGAFPAGGVWCHWARYDECTAAQKLWLFLGDSGYHLGAADDDCYVWAM